MKYVNTTFFPMNDIREAYKTLKGIDIRQMYIVVKARGRKDAERICAENGLPVEFSPNFSSETGNKDEIALCEKSKSNIIISRICGCKKDLVTLEQLKEVME